MAEDHTSKCTKYNTSILKDVTGKKKKRCKICFLWNFSPHLTLQVLGAQETFYLMHGKMRMKGNDNYNKNALTDEHSTAVGTEKRKYMLFKLTDL